MEAYDKAVSLLAMREHTEKEIREKLSARSFSPEDIDSAIGRLRREGLLSEERFAEVFIRSRLRKLPEGRALLSMRLRERKGKEKALATLYRKGFSSSEVRAAEAVLSERALDELE